MTPPYREGPEPGKLPRWYYWDPAHWRRWQVIGFWLLGIAALGRRAGCFTPEPPPVSMRTEDGKPGWYLHAHDLVELERRASGLCPNGWKRSNVEYHDFTADEYIIECQQKDELK